MVAVVAGLGTLEAVVAVVEVVLAEVFSVVEVAYWAGSSFSAFLTKNMRMTKSLSLIPSSPRVFASSVNYLPL